MATESVPSKSPSGGGSTWLNHWPLALGFALLAVPTLISVGRQVWSTEAGAQGPIILFTGLWLLWRKMDEFRAAATPGPAWTLPVLLPLALALYVFGRAYDFISLEVAGLYGVGLSLMIAYVGPRVLLANWFPFLYLAFLIPPPGWAVDTMTAPLKEFVSFASTKILELLGMPVEREGVILYVGQYEMLVEDACSGMKSLTGLIAITLFYIYLARNASWKYSAILVAMAIPIAIVANILRVMVLVNLTYFFGDAVGQGFLHTTAGLFLFATALALVFMIDSLMARIWQRRGGAV